MKLQLKWWRQGNRNIEVAASGRLYVNKQLSQEEIHLPWEEIRLDENWLGQVYLSSRDCIMWLQPFFFPPRRPSGDFLADPVHALFPGRLRSLIGACEQLWWNSIDLAELIKGKGVQSN